MKFKLMFFSSKQEKKLSELRIQTIKSIFNHSTHQTLLAINSTTSWKFSLCLAIGQTSAKPLDYNCENGLCAIVSVSMLPSHSALFVGKLDPVSEIANLNVTAIWREQMTLIGVAPGIANDADMLGSEVSWKQHRQGMIIE